MYSFVWWQLFFMEKCTVENVPIFSPGFSWRVVILLLLFLLKNCTWLLRYTLTLPNKLFLKGRKTSTVENYASAVSQSVVFLAPKNICIDLHFYVIFQARLDCKSFFFRPRWWLSREVASETEDIKKRSAVRAMQFSHFSCLNPK